MRAGFKKLLPSVLRRGWRRYFGWRWFVGDYPTWALARSASRGYDDPAVLERVVAAARAVREGVAVWDRDGVTFTDIKFHEPLLAALRDIGTSTGGRLRVVDFGGALGSTWWQNRSALKDFAVQWRVVEQPEFVEAGAEFSSAELSFETSVARACAKFEDGKPDLVLFSSVLQYLQDPGALLTEVIDRAVPHIIIDRAPFWAGGRHWIAVQRTPPSLGGGSYPTRIFDRATLLSPLLDRYECVSEWPGFDEVDHRVNYAGMHFSRKSPE